MRKKMLAYLLAAALLLAAFTGCSKEEESPTRGQGDTGGFLANFSLPEIPSEPDASEPAAEPLHEESSQPEPSEAPAEGDIVESDTVAFGLDSSYREWLPQANLAESYAFTKSLNGRDIVAWTYEVYLPLFTDELPYEEGADVIKAFYAQMAEEEEHNMRQYIQDGYEEIPYILEVLPPGSATQYYTYQSYAVDYLDPYLIVTFGGTQYMGGAHSMEWIDCHNFDMRTGQLLELDDVFADLEKDAGALSELLNRELSASFDLLAEADVAGWYDAAAGGYSHPFRIEKEGIAFLFQPYEVTAYAFGMPEVAIPYSELAPFLKLDLSEIK